MCVGQSTTQKKNIAANNLGALIVTSKNRRGPETLYLNVFQHSFLIHK